jgi:hypothetical protein
MLDGHVGGKILTASSVYAAAQKFGFLKGHSDKGETTTQ